MPANQRSFTQEFSFQQNTENIFSAYRGGLGEPSLIQFRLDGERISVRDDRNQTVMSATLGLNDLGECILRLEDGTELRSWQFRQKALERLLFPA